MIDPDVCRSLLFVPAGNTRYLDSALRGPADVIQIDLEDAIAPDQKASARACVGPVVRKIASAGRVGAVRINVEPGLLSQDLEAAVIDGACAVTIPKVDSASTLGSIDDRISALESERGLPVGGIRIIAQIESARGVLNAREIAHATPRLVAVGIGMEDLVAQIGGRVTDDALYFPNMSILYAAREAGVVPIGYLGSITVYDDVETFGSWTRRAAALGFEGGFCIHPRQAEILNDAFGPDDDAVAECRALVEVAAAHEREGRAVFVHDGRMVDKPVVDRARRVLQRWEKLQSRSRIRRP